MQTVTDMDEDTCAGWFCQVDVRSKRKSEKEQTLSGADGVTGNLLDDSTRRGRAQKQDDFILKEQGTGPKGTGNKHLEVVFGGKKDFHSTSWT